MAAQPRGVEEIALFHRNLREREREAVRQEQERQRRTLEAIRDERALRTVIDSPLHQWFRTEWVLVDRELQQGACVVHEAGKPDLLFMLTPKGADPSGPLGGWLIRIVEKAQGGSFAGRYNVLRQVLSPADVGDFIVDRLRQAEMAAVAEIEAVQG